MFGVGDILVSNTLGGGDCNSHTFVRVHKITPSGRYRVYELYKDTTSTREEFEGGTTTKTVCQVRPSTTLGTINYLLDQQGNSDDRHFEVFDLTRIYEDVTDWVYLDSTL